MPKSKIVLGIPTYGIGWTLTEPNTKNGIGAPGSRAKPCNYTHSPGIGAYYNVKI